ncbi:DUF3450 domain-containing protein [Desulfovulcanus sp.]
MLKYFMYFFCFLFFFSYAGMCEETPQKLIKSMQGVIKDAQKVQKEVDAWAMEREKLLSEISELKNLKRWYMHQQKKYETYIQKQKQLLAELQRRRKEARRINISLEPYLDDTVKRLEEFIGSDLNFLPEERQKRLAFLKDSLDDYHLGLSEKLRRVLEVLQVEAEYGRGIEKSEAVLTLDNKPTEVRLLRIGRVALFYQTLDGKRCGYMEAGGTWKDLPASFNSEISKALDMIDHRRAYDLIELPLRRVQP